MVLPSRNQAPEVVHPGEESLHLPPFSIAAELTAILSSAFAPASIRCNQFDAVLFSELRVERIRVIGFVADQPGWEFVEKTSGNNLFNKLALGKRSALDRYGERKTVISGDSDDLRALAAPGGPDGEAPFLALAKVASTNASSRFSWPRSCRYRARSLNASSSFPLRIHCWNLRWQVWYGGYFSGSSRHCAPVPNTHITPCSTARVSCQGRPRLSSRRRGRSTGSTTAHCSSVSSQRPVINACGDHRAVPGSHEFRRSVIYETGSRELHRNSPRPLRVNCRQSTQCSVLAQ